MMLSLRRTALGALLAPAVLLAGCQQDSTVVGPAVCSSTATGTATASVQTGASADVAAVVAAAEAFRATLTTAQQTTLQPALTLDNADNWSNLPVGTQNPRNGLRFDALTDVQRTAALAVADAALSDAGYGTFQSLRAADQYLRQNGGGNAYGENLYFIAFLGTPSTTSPWMLQLGGHHYAANIGYRNGLGSPTPNFVGTEPLSFTLNNQTYAPMAARASSMRALIGSLTSAQRTSATLEGTFGDVVVGPGRDGQFPAQAGLPVSTLDASQRALVVAAIQAWAYDADDDTRAALMATYSSEDALNQTRIGYSGTGNLTTQRDYVRIDGPRVWIEIVAQNGVVLSGIHYHSIWRDKSLDYGGIFSGVVGTEEDPC